MERERGRREATADMSEDLSEGERGDTVADMLFASESTKGRMRRISSVEMMDNWANTFKEKKLYVVLIRQELEKYGCLAVFFLRFPLNKSLLGLH